MAGDERPELPAGLYWTRAGGIKVVIYDPERKGGRRQVGTFDPDPGARPWKTALKAKQKAEAERDAREEERQHETVAAFAKRWVDQYHGPGTKRPEETTKRHNEERVRALVRDFGHRQPREITKPEARVWIKGGAVPPGLEQTASRWEGAERRKDGQVVVPAHRGNHSAVRAMFSDAVNHERLLDANPFAKLDVEQSDGRQSAVMLTPDELELLVETAEEEHGEEYGPLFGAMIEAAAWTGLRPGELFVTTRDDTYNFVDFAQDRIEVHKALKSKTREIGDTKSHQRRSVVLLPPARLAFQRAGRLQVIGSPLYFWTARDRAMFTTRTIHYYWDTVRRAFWRKLPASRQKLIPKTFDFYELRHFFGTRLGELPGMTPMRIAKEMGHKDGGKLAMRLYIHTEENDAHTAALEGYHALYGHKRERKADTG